MNHGIHFISGLPRSGSTLLAALLRQNPRFDAGMTSPVGAMYMALEAAMSRRNEFSALMSDQRRRCVLKGLFSNFYEDVHREKLVFDTNRAWCARLPALTQLFPESRVVCCVRDIGWIMDSIERLLRRNAFELSGLFNYDPRGTVYTRVNGLAASDGVVGFALDALREAFYGNQAEKLILLEYEALTRAPRKAMCQLYDLLDEPLFEHDFDNVEYQADEFDLAIGTRGLHTVRRKVEWIERQSVLPPDLFERFGADMFWRVPEPNAHKVRIIQHGD
jgi:sulfotransferase